MTEKMLGDFRLLTFDTFGTLIDWETGIWEALTPLCARLPRRVQRDEALEAFARAETEAQRATPQRLYRNLLSDVHANLAVDWGVEPDPRESAAFGASVPDWPAFRDASESLAYLRRFFCLATITNCDRTSYRGASKRLGDPWHAIWTAEDIGSYKPDKRNFDFLIARARSEFEADPEEILHVAQSLHHDILPAARFGLPYTAWIDRRHQDGGYGATMPPTEDASPAWRFSSLAALARQHMHEVERRTEDTGRSPMAP